MVTFEIESLKEKLFKTWFYLQNTQTGEYRARVAAVFPRQAMERFRQSLTIADEDILTVKPIYDDQGRTLCAFCNDPDPDDDFFRVHYNGFLGDMCQTCKEFLRVEECMVYQRSGIWYATDPPIVEAQVERYRKPLPAPKQDDLTAQMVTAESRSQNENRSFSTSQKKPGNQPGLKHEGTIRQQSYVLHHKISKKCNSV